MFRYAQLDETGRCVSVSFLSGEIEDPLMLLLDETEDVRPGDIWDGTTWTRPDPPPPSNDPSLSDRVASLETELAAANESTLTAYDALADVYEMVLALQDQIAGGGTA